MVKTVGIIGGTGYETLLPEGSWLATETIYGKVEFMEVDFEGLKVIFIPRHGREHNLPPHRVNYRGNIWLLKSRGAEYVIAINAVGSLRRILKPGMIVIPTDIIDLTKNRYTTFFDDKPVHVDFTEPFCMKLVRVLEKASEKVLGYSISGAVVAVTEGPRFESPAEINALRILGADIVGMTSAPEAALAKELGLCYASLALVTNYAAGMQEKQSSEDVEKVANEKRQQVFQIILETLKILKEQE